MICDSRVYSQECLLRLIGTIEAPHSLGTFFNRRTDIMPLSPPIKP